MTSNSNGPAYIAPASANKWRGLGRDLTPEENQRYGADVLRGIRARQAKDLERGLYGDQRIRCASGSQSNVGAEILADIRRGVKETGTGEMFDGLAKTGARVEWQQP